jgi:hypothetical protein
MKRSANIYLTACISGILLNFFLLTFAEAYFNFNRQSGREIFFHCEWGYIIKACIFSSIYFLFQDDYNFDNTTRRRAILRTPFVLFALWFFLIIHYHPTGLKTDISAGGILEFEHFVVQLISMFVVTFFLSLWIKNVLVVKTS